MAAKFQNKYRSESTRLQYWNYGWDAAYFITICTKGREHYFGKIVEGSMELSFTGVIADILWYEIKNHAANVFLGEFVVMPNHIHGIIILSGNDFDGAQGYVSGTDNDDDESDMVGTRPALSLPPPEPPNPVFGPPPPRQPSSEKTIGQQRFQNQGKNTLSSIVGSYKSAVTRHCNRLKFDFAWQPLFYDHIIRDKKSYERITEYIRNNPVNWKADKFHQ